MPVEIAHSCEQFAACLAKQLADRPRLPIRVVNSLVLRQIAMPLETFAAHIAQQRRLASVCPHVLTQFVRRKEPFFAHITRKSARPAVLTFAVGAHQGELGEPFATVETLVRQRICVTFEVFLQPVEFCECAVTDLACILAKRVLHEQLCFLQ